MVVCRLGTLCTIYGLMAELADAQDLKSCIRKGVWVRFPLCPPAGRTYNVPLQIEYQVVQVYFPYTIRVYRTCGVACNIPIIAMTCGSRLYGYLAKWSNAPDCKSGTLRFPWSESKSAHHIFGDSLAGKTRDFDSRMLSSNLGLRTIFLKH